MAETLSEQAPVWATKKENLQDTLKKAKDDWILTTQELLDISTRHSAEMQETFNATALEVNAHAEKMLDNWISLKNTWEVNTVLAKLVTLAFGSNVPKSIKDEFNSLQNWKLKIELEEALKKQEVELKKQEVELKAKNTKISTVESKLRAEQDYKIETWAQKVSSGEKIINLENDLKTLKEEKSDIEWNISKHKAWVTVSIDKSGISGSSEKYQINIHSEWFFWNLFDWNKPNNDDMVITDDKKAEATQEAAKKAGKSVGEIESDTSEAWKKVEKKEATPDNRSPDEKAKDQVTVAAEWQKVLDAVRDWKLDLSAALCSFKDAFKWVPFLWKLFDALFSMMNPKQQAEVQNLSLATKAIENWKLNADDKEFYEYLEKSIKPAVEWNLTPKETKDIKELQEKQFQASEEVLKSIATKNFLETSWTKFSIKNENIVFWVWNEVITKEFVKNLCKALQNSWKDEFKWFVADNKEWNVGKLVDYLNWFGPKDNTGDKAAKDKAAADKAAIAPATKEVAQSSDYKIKEWDNLTKIAKRIYWQESQKEINDFIADAKKMNPWLKPNALKIWSTIKSSYILEK